jgi:valyl-tRNA synthetase
VRFSEERVEGYRFFVNKLWNAARFVMMNAEVAGAGSNVPPPAQGLAERWIMSRLTLTAEEVNASLEDYRFNDAASSIYQFIWHEFCDWYIEMSKEALYGEGADKRVTITCLLSVLDASLRLLHPFMPFVTEEIWQAIRVYRHDAETESIVLAPFPVPAARDYEAEEEMSYVIEAVTGVRNIRGEMNISPGREVGASVKAFTAEASRTLKDNLSLIKRLARLGEVVIGAETARPKGAATAVRGSFELYVPLEGLLDIGGEIERLEKEKKKVRESLDLLDRKLGNEDFLRRAPAEIIEKEKAKYQELIQKDERLEKGINRLKEAGGD